MLKIDALAILDCFWQGSVKMLTSLPFLAEVLERVVAVQPQVVLSGAISVWDSGLGFRRKLSLVAQLMTYARKLAWLGEGHVPVGSPGSVGGFWYR